MFIDIADVRKTLNPVFDLYDITRAVLFGSYAKGTAGPKSDLDLMVCSNLRGLKFVGFIEDLNEAAGIPVDVFDVSHIEAGSRIAREIDDTGVVIYEK